MTGKSQKPSAKTQMVPAESLKKGGLEMTIFRSPPLISAPMLTVVGWNEWKQTTKREHSWYGCCIAHQDCVRDFSENKSCG